MRRFHPTHESNFNMQLFYNPNIKAADTVFLFDKEESKHIVKVLRKKESDILFVTNGLGFIFKTTIKLASDSKCTVEILSFEHQPESNFNNFFHNIHRNLFLLIFQSILCNLQNFLLLIRHLC